MKINKDFEISCDAYQWTVTQWSDGMNKKTSKPTRSAKKTFHGNIVQACEQVLFKSAKNINSVSEIVSAIYNAKEDILCAIEDLRGDA